MLDLARVPPSMHAPTGARRDSARSRRFVRPALLALLLQALVAIGLTGEARADEWIHADGRRTTVSAPRADSKGRWSAEIDGRRTPVKPGDVVAVVDGEGHETAIPNELTDDPWTPADDALLASLRDVRSTTWHETVESRVAPPRRVLLERLKELGTEKRADVRARATTALVMMRTKDAVRAAVDAVLAESDKSARVAGASALYSVVEIYRRMDLEEATRRGLADKESAVRFAFAWLAPDDFADAVPVLKRDGLANSDHHVKESAAFALARHGDAAGESILCSMLARDKIPGVDDADMNTRMLVREQVDVCRLLGKLATKGAIAALERATRSKHEAVRAAAAKALERARTTTPP